MTDEDKTTERTPADAEHLANLRKMIAALWATNTPADARAMMLQEIDAIAADNAALRARLGRLRDDLLHEVNRGRQDRGYVPLTAAEIERSRIRLRPGDLVEPDGES